MATASTKSPRRKGKSPRKWSGNVTKHSNALDLQSKIFKNPNADTVAKSLKRSAERSTRRKTTPFQSAMSMLNFYINRGGKNLSARRKAVLERAKEKLRLLFGRGEDSQQKKSKTKKNR